MPVPAEKDSDEGCYLKITFPKEMPLPDPADDQNSLTF
jgi:hypothetical protein